MFSTFSYFFQWGEKETNLLLFLADLLLLLSLSFFGGRWLGWLGVILWSIFFFAAFWATRLYEAWREAERQHWLKKQPDWNGAFPQKWVPYTDIWFELLGGEMSRCHIALLLFGKISLMVF